MHCKRITFLTDTKSNNSLKAILCDGTPVNTGRVGGVIKLLESNLGRPLHWFICLLHLNELILRHAFHFIDGKSSGPDSFTGSMGKHIKNLEFSDIIDYEIVPGCVDIIPDYSVNTLSGDQLYLYEICNAIKTGNFPHDLKMKSPGKLHHARWLTLANRVLRLYVSTPNPCNKLHDLVKIIMNCYAPGWFYIKFHPFVKDGLKNFWYQTKLVRKVDGKCS